MTKPWSNELKRIAFGTAAVLVVGSVFDRLVLVALLASVAYLGFNLFQVYRLERWLERRRQERPPESLGIWNDIFNELYWLQERTRQRKLKLASIIDRFKQASEATPDATVILRSSGAIEWLNQAAIVQLGLHSPQDIGRPIGDLLRDVELTAYLAADDYEDSIEIRSPVVDNRTLSVRVVPYGDDRRLLLARDVTRIHRLENVRRDFVANVSHELRSPLTVIRGYVETMEDSLDELGEQWEKPVLQMDQQVNRMCRIVDDLLALSRLESNPEAAASNPVRVAEMLETIRDDARGLTNEDLQVWIEADADLQLAGEYNELYSAFSNLVFNAVQYTPASRNIYLRWYADDAGAYLEVEDQGIGIEPEHISRLTERFYRVDKARSRAVGGTGLGLAIVKHVLVRHQATLHINSIVGEGSTFVCHFHLSRVSRGAVSSDRRAV